MSDTWIVVLATSAGVVTGVLSAMFGVGGAVVSTPAVRVLGAGPLAAVGSTLPSILPSALSGSLRYRHEGLIRTRIAVWTAAAGVPASVGGALLADVVPGGGHPLMLMTAALVAFSAYRLSRIREVEALPERAAEGAIDVGPHGDLVQAGARRDDWWRLTLTGLAAGGLSGLLGIGGGLLMVPSFTAWVRLPLKEALATSLTCVGILAIPGTVAHALLGNINWLYALPLCVGVVPGARLGAHLTIRASDRTLRILVSSVLGVIALVYGTGEILALV